MDAGTKVTAQTVHFLEGLRHPPALPPAVGQTSRLFSGGGLIWKKGHSAGDWNVLRFYTMVPEPAKQPGRIAPTSAELARAWLVHMYTGLGAVLAFVAGYGIIHGNDRLALGALFIATLVDATDGVLARAARVKQVLPHIDGGHIDDIVDYMTFVLLPMLLLEAAGGLYFAMTFPVVAIVLLSSLYGFIAPDAKTDDHFFTGFPSYWNIVVLYLLLFRVPPGVNALVLLVLSALVFVRIGWVYPSRTATLQRTTVVLGGIWTLLIGAIIWMWPGPPRWMAIASLVFPVYYLVLSLVLHSRRGAVAAR